MPFCTQGHLIKLLSEVYYIKKNDRKCWEFGEDILKAIIIDNIFIVTMNMHVQLI